MYLYVYISSLNVIFYDTKLLYCSVVLYLQQASMYQHAYDENNIY